MQVIQVVARLVFIICTDYWPDVGAGWEADITQVACTGTGATAPPYSGTTNHLGRCGYINVYSFSGSGCYIGPFDA